MNVNTMPLEADTRVLIDRTLENLGWKLKGKDKNVFYEQPRTEAEKKKLGGKRPDYVLYSKDTDKPLIIIEAKKKGSRIDDALQQGIEYARAIDAPLVFATDGVFCKAFHTYANRPPILNGEEVDEFIREALALRYLTSHEVNTVSPKVQYDRKELIRIFDEANNMLRGEGLRAGIERFGEFANILFLKLISESEQIKRENGIATKFDPACSWETIKSIPFSTRIEYINKTVYDKLNALYNTDIFTPLQIRDASILKEIMDKLDPLMLTDVDSDVKGDAFEYFLKASTATKNDLGEYFTPRHIVKTMVRLVNPQIGEKVYDPFCGTGGFLIESFRYIHNNMPRNPNTERILREETVYGNEITNTARITKMNMILAGDGHSNIQMMDSLANPVEGKYDIVLANMPYSQKTKYGHLYDLPSTNGDSICVQHCMKAISSMSENGRMALVVPEGFLFRKDLAKTREYLLENCQLQSIISLPQGVFLPYTGVKTDIIYATKVNQKIKKSEKRKDFWYFDVKSDGYTLDNHRRKLDTPSDISKYEEYRKLDSEQIDEMLKVGFEIIPLDKVRKNHYILVGSRYRSEITISNYETVDFSDIATLTRGVNYQKSQQTTYKTNNIILPADNVTLNGELNVVKEIYVDDTVALTDDKRLKHNDIFVCMSSGSKEHIGKVAYVYGDTNYYAGGFMGIIRTNPSRCLPRYLYFYLLYSEKYREEIKMLTQGANINNISSTINSVKIPLPPLEVQKKIVDELNAYQQIILGAKRITDNYIPFLSWNIKETPMQKLGNVVTILNGYAFPIRLQGKNGQIPFYKVSDMNTIGNEVEMYNSNNYVTIEMANEQKWIIAPKDTVIFPKIGAAIATNKKRILTQDSLFDNNVMGIVCGNQILPKFLLYLLNSFDISKWASLANPPSISRDAVINTEIPVPTIEYQQKLVEEIEDSKKIVYETYKLIETYNKKIGTIMKELWSE